jgi:hypothetical protein
MPKYSVIVTGDATVSQTITVVAQDERQAEEFALECVDPSNWEWDDCNTPHEIYTTGVDEIDNPNQCKTRADLFNRPSRKTLDLEKDSNGNPCVWLNFYRDAADRCYREPWSCQCDDDGLSPFDSGWIGPDDQAEVALWESLKDA